MTKSLVCSILLLLSFDSLFCQEPLEIRRNSKVEIRLEKKGKRELMLSLFSGDEIKIRVSTKKRVNFRIMDPNGLVVHENVGMIKPVEWQKQITSDGVYSFLVENVDKVLATEVDIMISLRRPRFTYGSGVAGSSQSRTMLKARSHEVLTEGRVQIVTGNPRKYPYMLEKGDTLIVDIKGLTNLAPFVEISNAQKELLHASLPEKRRNRVTIPILETGAHELLLYSLFLTKNPLIPMYDSIRVERISPTRYIAPVISADTITITKPILYDTLAEVVMDSIFYAGAGRDYVHPSHRVVDIPISHPQNIIYWVLLFGAGKEFEQAYRAITTEVNGQLFTAQELDPMLAFGRAQLNQLPGPGARDIIFFPSPTIAAVLDLEGRPNYGRIMDPGLAQLGFENLSKSVGHPVYVKAVVFRRVARIVE